VSRRYQLGVDVGGTFTDAFMVDLETSEVSRTKVLSTPADQSLGTIEAIESLGISPAEIDTFCHGSTVGINALLERKGVKTGLICSEGTRDLLDIGRLRRPYGDNLYDPTWTRPHLARPIVPRRYVREVTGRMLADGSVYVELEEEQVRAEVEFLRDEGIESIAICLLHANLNDDHERRVVQLVREIHPDAYVQSSSVRPVVGEYARTLAVVIDAYTGPLIQRYLRGLADRLRERGYEGEVLMMQMNGGVRTIARTAEHFPAYVIQSGPVAGVLGAQYYATEMEDRSNLICMDIGGTSTDIGLVIDGESKITENWEFEFNLPLGAPSVDVRSFGAGGGSIIAIDEMGTLAVGPRSAGADPGPACYGRGGTEPALSDAYVALGIIDPDRFVAGGMELDREAAIAALTRVGEPVGLTPQQLAAGAIELVNAEIEGELRSFAFEAALDLREFSLLAYGGAGPVHAAAVAERMGMREAIIPFFPGGFSALGMVHAPLKVEHARSVLRPVEEIGPERLAEIFDDLEKQAVDDLVAQGLSPDQVRLDRSLYGMYSGQSFENRLPLPPAEGAAVTAESLAAWKEDFHTFYDRIYGYSAPEMEIVAVTAAVVGIGPAREIPMVEDQAGATTGSRTESIEICLDGRTTRSVPLVDRDGLASGSVVEGPAVIDDGLSTILVTEGWEAGVDPQGNIHLRASVAAGTPAAAGSGAASTARSVA
jgi:N-methylhydantoinase A